MMIENSTTGKKLALFTMIFAIMTVIALISLVLAGNHDEGTRLVKPIGEVATALTMLFFFPIITFTGFEGFWIKFLFGVAIYSVMIFGIIEGYRKWKTGVTRYWR